MQELQYNDAALTALSPGSSAVQCWAG